MSSGAAALAGAVMKRRTEWRYHQSAIQDRIAASRIDTMKP